MIKESGNTVLPIYDKNLGICHASSLVFNISLFKYCYILTNYINKTMTDSLAQLY